MVEIVFCAIGVLCAYIGLVFVVAYEGKELSDDEKRLKFLFEHALY